LPVTCCGTPPDMQDDSESPTRQFI